MDIIKIRKAVREDRFAISRLTRSYPNTLPRSPKEIKKRISRFFVAENTEGTIVGCCGSKIWNGDAEIISWIVSRECQGKGIGSKLLVEVIRALKNDKRIDRIFSITTKALADRFFKKRGFVEVGIQMFPEKILSDCQRCRKNRCFKGKYACDEVALLL